MNKQPCVYILSSQRNGILYVGVTSDLIKRVYQHRNSLVDSFTKRYAVHGLACYEVHEFMESAILWEKQIKSWDRRSKIGLIEKSNPDWRDIWPALISSSLNSGFRRPPWMEEVRMRIWNSRRQSMPE